MHGRNECHYSSIILKILKAKYNIQIMPSIIDASLTHAEPQLISIISERFCIKPLKGTGYEIFLFMGRA